MKLWDSDSFYPRNNICIYIDICVIFLSCLGISDQNKDINVTRLPGLLAIPNVFTIIFNDQPRMCAKATVQTQTSHNLGLSVYYKATHLLQLSGQLKDLVINYLNCLYFFAVCWVENVELINSMRNSENFILLLSKKLRTVQTLQVVLKLKSSH